MPLIENPFRPRIDAPRAPRRSIAALLLLSAVVAFPGLAQAQEPSGPYVAEGGQVVMEAETGTTTARNAHNWITGQSPAGFTNQAVQAAPDNGSGAGTPITTTAAGLSIPVQFDQAGTWYVWIRGYAPNTAGNSVHLSIDGAEPSTAANLNTNTFGQWLWFKSTLTANTSTVTVPSTGLHTVNVYLREDGFHIDRLLLTRSASYTPTGAGPAASPRTGQTDTTAPQITTRTPAPGATGVATDANITVGFSEPLNPATVTTASLTLTPAGGQPVPADITLSPDRTTATLDPTAPLTPGTSYTAALTSAITDTAGNQLTPTTWTLTTAADTVPPQITTRTPAPDATDVALGTTVGIGFSEPLDPLSVSQESVTLRPLVGEPVVGEILLSGDGRTVTFDPAQDLPEATTFTVTVSQGITDSVGNALADSQEWSFTTVPPAGSAWIAQGGQVVIEAEHPSTNTPRSSRSWTPTTGPSGFVAGAMTSGPDSGSTITASVTTNSPELTYPVLFAAAGTYHVWIRGHAPGTASNSLHVALDGGEPTTAVDMNTNTWGPWVWFRTRIAPPTATLSVPTPGLHTVSVFMREDGFSIDRMVLTTNGAFTPTGNGPAASSRGTAGGDTTPPELVNGSPDDGSTMVPRGTDVTIAFSEAMEAATVTPDSFNLRTDDGTVVPATIRSSAANAFVLSPVEPLAIGTHYTVSVLASVTDRAGNPLPAPRTLGFTTAATGELVADDVIDGSGLGGTINTQGENCVFDHDGDGIADVLLSTHGSGPWRLMRGSGDGTYAQVQPGAFPDNDRHGCATGDFGGLSESGALTGPDGRMDVYTTIGACQGTCTRPYPNELWLQKPDGSFADAAAGAGVTDERGRGREPVTMDVDRNGLADLFVGNEESQLYLSANRIFLNQGGTFTAPSGPVVAEVGSTCSATGDYDGDGWTDLVNCATSRLQLFRNVTGQFQEVTSGAGLGAVSNPEDAELADIDGDGDLDLLTVQVGAMTLRLNRGGAFPIEDHRVQLSSGRDLAIGDADGDGRPDVYIVQGNNASYSDLLLINLGSVDGAGRWRFRSAPVPQASSGDGDTAQALPDHAGTGRAAFLVNNGKYTSEGPRQLILMVPQ